MGIYNLKQEGMQSQYRQIECEGHTALLMVLLTWPEQAGRNTNSDGIHPSMVFHDWKLVFFL